MGQTPMSQIASFASDFEAKLKLAKAPKDLTDQIRVFRMK